MNSGQELNEVKDRLNQLEHKVDELTSHLKQQHGSPGRRIFTGFGITIVVIILLLMVIGILQFVNVG
ncbi:tetrahydromethanopterin S-methyltransferase subunit G [Paenibacillus silvae]|uniref:tetrahydromethanopterin S-methyltransferase subunit G n=1 Tax=Paenibacillus silvae TaxID=1325358 RepID=UPI0020039DF4|nr:tetrahydromethanopterin S-methyltransferase subunit G [Paenibacillus silvae]MCK6073831.1 tetrahydromethanopterin S-methyltransferase subunit G [Paenibacillus silvae]MCK6148693.1 tetrahydromethanopterin S-methyltransferase subunit G [Paenibacillus silvae]MCK6266993.1 tetrahydromethanopterin S-methyltransferase subunit G [Paenibacillus silvae]